MITFSKRLPTRCFFFQLGLFRVFCSDHAHGEIVNRRLHAQLMARNTNEHNNVGQRVIKATENAIHRYEKFQDDIGEKILQDSQACRVHEVDGEIRDLKAKKNEQDADLSMNCK